MAPVDIASGQLLPGLVDLLTSADEALPPSRFSSINPSAGLGSWLMTQLDPADALGSWHAAVVPFGLGEVVYSRRPVPRELVPIQLRALGLTGDVTWKAEPTLRRAQSPWTPESRLAVEVADTRDVYFIQALEGGPIKIGVAGCPSARMADIQRMSPFRLQLLAVISSVGQARETELHQQFAHLRMHGEWFRPAPELLELIAFYKKVGA